MQIHDLTLENFWLSRVSIRNIKRNAKRTCWHWHFQGKSKIIIMMKIMYINWYYLQNSTCLFDWIKERWEEGMKRQPQRYIFLRDVWWIWKNKETLKSADFSVFGTLRTIEDQFDFFSWAGFSTASKTQRDKENFS